MKKTIQIHIGGRHFHIDEDGYSKLSHYLDSLKAHFAAEGDAGKEIVDDIEQRIAELLENKITNGKQAASREDVEEIIRTLGTVEDFVYNGQPADQPEYNPHDRRDHRRFYRDSENYYLGGVASGLGEYFDIDPLWIRLAFVALVFLKGLGVLIYLILWIVVPKARTTAEKLQMKGKPVNLTTIKESVNAEYGKVRSNIEGMSRSESANRTRNALENLMRAIGLVFVALFKFVIGAIGIFFLVLGSIFLAGLIMLLLGFTNIFGHIQPWHGIYLPDISQWFASSGHYYLVVISLVILVLIPIIALIYGGIKILFNFRTRHPVLRAFTLTAWILALILFITLLLVNSSHYGVGATDTQTATIESPAHPRLRVEVRDNTEDRNMTQYWIFDHKFYYSRWDEELYERAELTIEPSEDDKIHLAVNKHVRNFGVVEAEDVFDRVSYQWEVADSVLYLNEYLHTDDEDFWMFARVELELRVPEKQTLVLSQKTCDLLDSYQRDRYCYESEMTEKSIRITADGWESVK